MELSDLRSFVDVAETLNIRRAATAAGVRPSTLSRRIARIEGELGVSVFERHASGVRLTRAGGDFFDTASNAIREIEFGLRRARAASNGASGHLRSASLPRSRAVFLMRPSGCSDPIIRARRD